MPQQIVLPDNERQAMEYVRDIKAFYTHLISYLVTILLLGVVKVFGFLGGTWYLWLVFGWCLAGVWLGYGGGRARSRRF